MKTRMVTALFLVLFVFFPPGVSAELKNENLIYGKPEGYKVDFEKREGKLLVVEWVPKFQTVQNWKEMLTIQTYIGGLPYTPEGYYLALSDQWTRACRGGSGQLISTGKENGYLYALWFMICPLNNSTGKPEHAWFKAIQGNDSFYVIHKAWKYAPSKQEVEKWTTYLRKVMVCDNRVPGRACPKVSK